jgi:membrane fusion protein, multidrug efflux system
MKMKFILVVFATAFLATACDKKDAKNAAAEEKHVDSLKVFLLKAEKLEKHISLPGELFSYEKVEVRPKLTGYIKQLKVDIGSPVKKGQVIAVIDAPEVQSRLGEGTGRMNASKAKYETSLDTYQRIVEASKTAGVISPSEMQKARNQMLSDSADYQAQKFSNESYKQVGAYLAITAPFNGVITQRNINEGSYVGNPNEKPILIIEDNSRLRLRIAIPEALTGVSLKDNKVKFTTRSYPNKNFEASLVRKAGSIDINTRTEIWEFEVENKNNNLKAGAFANVNLNISREQPTFFVPFSAVVTTLERKFVIRISNDSTKWVDVSPGLNLAEKVEIFGPLNEGDKLVLKANEEIKPNEKVAVKF